MCLLVESENLAGRDVAGSLPEVSDPPAAGEARLRDTREQILRAAHRCLVETGFEKITTRRIAEAAQVNIATLHYHFGSKEALLSATVAFASAESERAIREAIAAAPTVATALEAGLKRVWELVQQRSGILRYDLIVRGLRDADARRDANSIYAAFMRISQEVFERHIEAGGTLAGTLTPQRLAQYYVSVIDGVVLQHTISGDDEAAKLGLSLILNQAYGLMGIGNGQVDDAAAGF